MIKKCKLCGISVNGDAKYCPECGLPITGQSSLEDSLSKRIRNYFDSTGKLYQVFSDGNVFKLNYSGNNGVKIFQSINITIVVVEDKNEIHLRVFNYIQIPNNKKDDFYRVCTQMNKSYNWARFYIDEKNNSVTVASDALVELRTDVIVLSVQNGTCR